MLVSRCNRRILGYAAVRMLKHKDRHASERSAEGGSICGLPLVKLCADVTVFQSCINEATGFIQVHDVVGNRRHVSFVLDGFVFKTSRYERSNVSGNLLIAKPSALSISGRFCLTLRTLRLKLLVTKLWEARHSLFPQSLPCFFRWRNI